MKRFAWPIALAAAVIVAWFQSCAARDANAAKQAALDSGVVWLERARTADDQRAGARREIMMLELREISLRDSAASARRVADSLRLARRSIVAAPVVAGAAPTPSDSVAALHAKLDNCEQESEALRDESGWFGDQIAVKDQQLTVLRIQAATDSAAIRDGQRTVTQLRDQVKRLEVPCSFGPFGCPSRKTVLVGALTIGFGLGLVIAW